MELGFTFYPAENPQALGHPQLDVNLYAAPTGEHFDPHQLRVIIRDPVGGLNHLTLSHPVEGTEFALGFGRIEIVDFAHKEIEAFSFGGRIEAENYPDHTACRLTSPAPIFDLGRFGAEELQLVSEFEAELAIQRAHYELADPDFDQRLAVIDPVELFLALAVAVDERQHALPVGKHTEQYWEFQHWLHQALKFINPEGKPPEGAKRIEELLG